jgi:UDP-N-acetyl-D-galactosamine dehydrogenase
MGSYVANKFVKQLIKKEYKINKADVLVLGITFKENCPDIRNSRVIDIINELNDFGCNVDVYDPWVDKEEVKNEYGFDVITKQNDLKFEKYKGIILAVAHNEFKNLNYLLMKNNGTVVYDVKGILNKELVDGRL